MSRPLYEIAGIGATQDTTGPATHVRLERDKQINYGHYPPEKVAFFMRTPQWCR